MQRKIYFLFTFIIFCSSLKAVTYVASSITYKHIIGSRYKLIVKLLRDCRGTSMSSNPGTFKIYAGSKSFNVSATRTGIREVSFNTKVACNPTNSIAGFGQEEHTFESDIDVDTIGNAAFTNVCQVYFSFETCCKNSSIKNLQAGQLYIECMLDKCLASQNNGPVFLNTRQIYARYNSANYYNIVAYDSIDNDLLVYNLSGSMNNKNSYETYTGNYTPRFPVSPLCTQSGQLTCNPSPSINPPRGLYFDSLNGSLIYTPVSTAENSIVHFKVNEYRIINGNKQLIGFHTQEFISSSGYIIPNQPVLTKNSLKFNHRVKVGSKISIDFATESKDTMKQDSVRIWVTNPIKGSLVQINSKWRSDGTFSWTPKCTDYREEPYFFIVHFYNKGDSLTGDYQSVAFNVYVDKDLDLGNDTLICKNKSYTLKSNQTGSYQWNGNYADTFNTYTAISKGKYWLDLTRNGCTLTDTVVLSEIENLPDPNLGRDTILCNQAENSNITLFTTYEANVKYTWNVAPNVFLSTLSYSGSGEVILNAENVCGAKADSIFIQRINSPQIQLPKDTQLCIPFTYQIQAKHGQDSFSYTWNDASTDSFLTVQKGGLYTLQASNVCGEAKDSILIKASILPILNLGADTIVCFKQYPLLKAGKSESTYFWSNGNTDSFLQCNDTGLFFVRVTHYCGVVSDSIHIASLSSPKFDLGKDTTFCSSFKIKLKAGNANTYIWNTGETNSEINVQNAGTYSVIASNKCASTLDSIHIYQKSAPVVNLGKDTFLKKPFSILLDAGNTADRYLWNTSAADTFQTLVVNDFGTYSVRADNVCGTVIDFIIIGEDLGLSEMVSKDIKVYPNPHQGFVFIDSKDVLQKVELLNTQGKLLNTFEGGGDNSLQIDLSALPSGIYLIRVQTVAGTFIYSSALSR